MLVESREQLQQYLLEIDAWEKDQKGLWFWEKLGRIPFRILDKFTPQFIQDKIGLMISELGKYVQTGGQFSEREGGY